MDGHGNYGPSESPWPMSPLVGESLGLLPDSGPGASLAHPGKRSFGHSQEGNIWAQASESGPVAAACCVLIIPLVPGRPR